MGGGRLVAEAMMGELNPSCTNKQATPLTTPAGSPAGVGDIKEWQGGVSLIVTDPNDILHEVRRESDAVDTVKIHRRAYGYTEWTPLYSSANPTYTRIW